MKIALIIFLLLTVTPVMAYLIMKYATFGYHRGKEMWERDISHENNQPNDGKE